MSHLNKIVSNYCACTEMDRLIPTKVCTYLLFSTRCRISVILAKVGNSAFATLTISVFAEGFAQKGTRHFLLLFCISRNSHITYST